MKTLLLPIKRISSNILNFIAVSLLSEITFLAHIFFFFLFLQIRNDNKMLLEAYCVIIKVAMENIFSVLVCLL